MRFWGKLGALLALLLLSTALIAACSGDDDDDDGGDEMTATATETMTATETQEPNGGNGGGGGGGGGAAIGVALSEWEVAPEVEMTGPGSVTFSATNDGAVPHEFVVIRTDDAPDSLPTDASLVDEAAVDVVGRTQQMLPGETLDLTVDLEPGKYVLICNIAGHYALGMHVAFTVE